MTDVVRATTIILSVASKRLGDILLGLIVVGAYLVLVRTDLSVGANLNLIVVGADLVLVRG